MIRSKDQTHFEILQITKADSQKINRIKITKCGSTIELTKKDNQWTFGPKAYPAASVMVKNVVKVVVEVQVTVLVYESAKYERFDPAEDKRVRGQAGGHRLCSYTGIKIKRRTLGMGLGLWRPIW